MNWCSAKAIVTGRNSDESAAASAGASIHRTESGSVDVRMTFRRRFDVRRVLVVNILLLSRLATLSAAPPTHLQVRQALSVARMAADHGFQDLSLKAVRDALNHGPPGDSIQPEFRIELRSARIDTSAVTRLTTADPVVEIHDSLMDLARRWQTDGYDRAAVCQTLADVVMPKHFASRVVCYVHPASVDPYRPNHLPQISSIARMLVERANAAGRLPDVRDQLGQQAPTNTAQSHLLAAMIAMELRDEDDLARHLEAAAASLQDGADAATAQLAVAVASDAFDSGMAASAAANLLDDAARLVHQINAAAGVSRNSPSRACLLTAARALFATEQPQAAVDTLSAYLTVEVPSCYSNSSHDGYLRQRRKVVAEELYSRGLVADARRLLKDYAAAFERRYRDGRFSTSESLAVATQDAAAQGAAAQGAAQSAPRVIPESDVAGTEADSAVWLMVGDMESELSRRLFVFPDFTAVTHLAVSPDGLELAMAANLHGRTSPSQSRIFVLPLNGGPLRDLGPGTLPSWSPRGRRLTVSRYTPERGVWVLRSDGSDAQLLDELGWGSQWSPDGRMIACAGAGAQASPIIVHDLVEEDVFPVQIAIRDRGQLVTSSLRWLPDSRRISFWLTNRNANAGTASFVSQAVFNGDSATVHLTQEATEPVAETAWAPDASQLVFDQPQPAEGRQQLFVASGTRDHEPRALKGQPPGRRNSSAAWSPDGKSLYYVSRK
ncbi:MAG: hypothetical protein R3C19_25085 [Planctomycetaceae bacterium]